MTYFRRKMIIKLHRSSPSVKSLTPSDGRSFFHAIKSLLWTKDHAEAAGSMFPMCLNALRRQVFFPSSSLLSFYSLYRPEKHDLTQFRLVRFFYAAVFLSYNNYRFEFCQVHFIYFVKSIFKSYHEFQNNLVKKMGTNNA